MREKNEETKNQVKQVKQGIESKTSFLAFNFLLESNCILHCCFRIIMTSLNLKPSSSTFVLTDYTLEQVYDQKPVTHTSSSLDNQELSD